VLFQAESDRIDRQKQSICARPIPLFNLAIDSKDFIAKYCIHWGYWIGEKPFVCHEMGKIAEILHPFTYANVKDRLSQRAPWRIATTPESGSGPFSLVGQGDAGCDRKGGSRTKVTVFPEMAHRKVLAANLFAQALFQAHLLGRGTL
jgi:hypothetical protein